MQIIEALEVFILKVMAFARQNPFSTEELIFFGIGVLFLTLILFRFVVAWVLGIARLSRQIRRMDRELKHLRAAIELLVDEKQRTHLKRQEPTSPDLGA